VDPNHRRSDGGACWRGGAGWGGGWVGVYDGGGDGTCEIGSGRKRQRGRGRKGRRERRRQRAVHDVKEATHSERAAETNGTVRRWWYDIVIVVVVAIFIVRQWRYGIVELQWMRIRIDGVGRFRSRPRDLPS